MEWKKPAVAFYRENLDKPETEPFAVIKAKKMTVESTDGEGFRGDISDFFVLMGDVDRIPSKVKEEGYALCWFDDAEEDFRKAFRKLNGVTFSSGLSFTTSEGKRTYNASFRVRSGKLY